MAKKPNARHIALETKALTNQSNKEVRKSEGIADTYFTVVVIVYVNLFISVLASQVEKQCVRSYCGLGEKIT